MQKNVKKRLFIVSFIFILVILFLSIFFILKKDNFEESVIKSTEHLSINYDNGNRIKINQNKTITFSIINSSEEDVYYYIEFINLKNIKGKINYTLTNNKDIKVSDTLNSFNTIISSYILIKSLSNDDYTLTFNSDEDIKYSLEINIAEERNKESNFTDTILDSNEIKENSITKIGSISTTDEGLIKSNDDYGTTYYFRGNVVNNYVLINNLYFRIVRINGDGSIKIVLDGITDSLKKYYESIEDYSYKNSVINDYLNNEWLKNNLRDYEYFIATSKYCNDININNGDFLALTRLEKDNIPSFICLGDKIQNKVGLLTADEVIYAGGSLSEDNTNYYLYNSNITTNYYLMTSAQLNDYYYPFMVSKSGKLVYSDSGNNLRAVRPVITIIKTVSVTGDGTIDNPYVLIKE